ncbi:MAG: THUMP domain-containing protein [Candidatus Aenigmatarchaeota archaeon]
MRKHDCLLLRVGEAALKSEQVQRKWNRILLENIRAALKGIDYDIQINPSRFFVYTKSIKRVQNRLKRVFGITSVSPCWVCRSELDEISRLAVDVARKIRVKKGTSFAIRTRRAGRHKFTSRAIAENAGAAVLRATKARVNLTKPKKEIFIECRSSKTYIFTEKIPAVGGLPLGTAGKMLAIVRDKRDMVAAWLMMRRGAELVVIGNAGKLRKWHIGKELKAYRSRKKIKEIIKKEKIIAVVSGKMPEKEVEELIKKENVLLLLPLVGWESKKINSFKRVLLH